MAIPIKSAAEIAEKWVRNSSNARADYEAGVRNPSKDWATETTRAESNYEQGVQLAISNKMFVKGVRDAGTEKQKTMTIEKGIPRWQPGISAGKSAYADGFEPYRATISALVLPERYPAGDPRNNDRVDAITDALHRKKLAG